jgi:alpha-tubulin suppressor-like RCC1 family protein
VKKIALSQTSLAILCTDGSVVLSGINSSGGMGVGNTAAYRTPTLRTDISNIQDIAFDISLSDTTYYLSNDGQIYGSGLSTSGQLATTTSSNTFRLVVNNTNQRVFSINPAIEGLIFFKRSSTGAGNISVLGRHFSGSLGTGSVSNVNYSTPQNVVSISATTLDPVIVTGTYHARYWVEPNRIYFTGATGNFVGVNSSFQSSAIRSFTSQGISPFEWKSYAQLKGDYTASYVISNGTLYGAGNGLLSGFSTVQSTYVSLDTTIIS